MLGGKAFIGKLIFSEDFLTKKTRKGSPIDVKRNEKHENETRKQPKCMGASVILADLIYIL